MSSRRGFLSEISWFQVAASALAAVTAAWIASRLGVAGTLIGAALGSFVVTISTSFYGRTLDKGKTLIVQTASGTSVEKTLVDGEIAAAFHEVEQSEGSPVLGAEVVDDAPRRRLRWKVIIPTTLIVLAISIGAMGAYEVVTGNSYGIDRDNARIGNPLGGSSSSSDEPDDTEKKKPAKDDETSTPAPAPTVTTPTPAPSATTTPAPAPAPAPSTAPAPTPTPTPSATPTPSVTPTVPAE